MRSGPGDQRAENLKSEEGQKRRFKKYFPNISTETCITGEKKKNNDTPRKIWTDSLKGMTSLMSFIRRLNNYLFSPCHVLGTVLGSAMDRVPVLKRSRKQTAKQFTNHNLEPEASGRK